MKREICVRSMVLGAVIMLTGLAVGAITSPPLIAQRNGVFDYITCRGIEVVDKHGKTGISLDAYENSSYISIFDKTGNAAIELAVSEIAPPRNIQRNSIKIKDKVELAVLYDIDKSVEINSLNINNKAGNTAISLGVSDDYTMIDISDKAGNEIINLFGLEGSSQIWIKDIKMLDKADNIVWEAP